VLGASPAETPLHHTAAGLKRNTPRSPVEVMSKMGNRASHARWLTVGECWGALDWWHAVSDAGGPRSDSEALAGPVVTSPGTSRNALSGRVGGALEGVLKAAVGAVAGNRWCFAPQGAVA